jgi:arylformamidase
MRLSVHTGSHADAPYHYDPQGATMESVDLSVYIGSAYLLDMSGRAVIQVEDLAPHISRAPRLLLRTGVWEDHSRFPERIPVLAPDAPDFLGRNGVRLIGLDVPSVDALDSADLPNHHALGRNGIAILESLHLKGVPEGLYELIALPLRLTGADGSPVRAVLRSPHPSRGT